MQSVNLIELSDNLIKSWSYYYKTFNDYEHTRFMCWLYPRLPVWAKRRLITRWLQGDLDEIKSC
jgi:hypothetical protein